MLLIVAVCSVSIILNNNLLLSSKQFLDSVGQCRNYRWGNGHGPRAPEIEGLHTDCTKLNRLLQRKSSNLNINNTTKN